MDGILELYWFCFIGGALFALVAVIFDDMISHIFHGLFDFAAASGFEFLNSTTLVSGVTAFGGAGILLSQYSGLNTLATAIISLLIAVLLSIALYFLYIKPMNKAENSIGFSLSELVGCIAEVSVPLPSKGFGEVVVKVGAGNTNEIASSMDGVAIETGARVVVIQVKDSVLYVSRFE